MAKPQFLQFDNLDDRKEVHCILARLTPARRLKFLAWACTQAHLDKSQAQPRVSQKTLDLAERARWDSSANERLTLGTYLDLWMLAMQFRVDLKSLIEKLEAFASGQFAADPAEPLHVVKKLGRLRA